MAGPCNDWTSCLGRGWGDEEGEKGELRKLAYTGKSCFPFWLSGSFSFCSFLPSWQPPLPFVGTTPDSFHANLEKDKYMIGERPPHPRALREGRVSLGQRQAILQSSLFSLQYDETLVAGYRGRCLSSRNVSKLWKVKRVFIFSIGLTYDSEWGIHVFRNLCMCACSRQEEKTGVTELL